MYGTYGPDEVRAALDHSLAALQTDVIDLYQIHWPVNVGLHSEASDRSRRRGASSRVPSLQNETNGGGDRVMAR